MCVDKALADSQSQSCTTGKARQTCVNAVEALENLLAFLGRDARSVIFDAEDEHFALMRDLNSNGRSLAGIFYSVLDQVAENSFKTRGICI